MNEMQQELARVKDEMQKLNGSVDDLYGLITGLARVIVTMNAFLKQSPSYPAFAEVIRNQTESQLLFVPLSDRSAALARKCVDALLGEPPQTTRESK